MTGTKIYELSSKLKSTNHKIQRLKFKTQGLKRALIRMELTPSYFSRFEFPLQCRGTKEDRRIKNKDYVFYCHKQLINLSTC